MEPSTDVISTSLKQQAVIEFLTYGCLTDYSKKETTVNSVRYIETLKKFKFEVQSHSTPTVFTQLGILLLSLLPRS